MSEKNGKPVTNGFISHKELCEAFHTGRKTLKNEIKKIPGLQLRPMQRYYSPKEQQIIFNHLGNPFQVT